MAELFNVTFNLIATKHTEIKIIIKKKSSAAKRLKVIDAIQMREVEERANGEKFFRDKNESDSLATNVRGGMLTQAK